MLYVIFSLYLALMLGVGFLSMKKTNTHADFLIGSRKMGPVTSAISAGASDMSSWLLLGLPGAVFAFGLVEGLWISLGLTIGAYLNWLIVAGRLRSLSEKFEAITLPSFIAKRFDDDSGLLKIVSTVVILFFFTLYVASGLKGGTLLFAHAFGASEMVALIITTLVVVSYTFLGGDIAVCWTDLIQGLLMLAALVFCALLGWIAIQGSTADIIATNPAAFKLSTGTLTIASSLAWGFGYFGQPHILARFFGIRSIKDVRNARRVGISWMILSLVLACAIGLIGIGYNAVHELPGLTGEGGNSERVFLALTTALFHPVFAGFVLAAVLAAVMSTADSQLLVLTSSLTEDIPFIAKLPDERKKLISRLGVVGFALLAFVIAATDRGSILAMVGYAWGGFGAAFAPLVLLSVLWKGTTKWGAFAGMITGSATIFVVKNYITVPGEYFYELLPGFFVALVSIIIVSLFTKKPSNTTLADLAETQKEVRDAHKK